MNSGTRKYHFQSYYTNTNESHPTLRVATLVEQNLLRVFLTSWTIAGQPLTDWKLPTEPIANLVKAIEGGGECQKESIIKDNGNPKPCSSKNYRTINAQIHPLAHPITTEELKKEDDGIGLITQLKLEPDW